MVTPHNVFQLLQNVAAQLTHCKLDVDGFSDIDAHRVVVVLSNRTYDRLSLKFGTSVMTMVDVVHATHNLRARIPRYILPCV